jgi:beta-xylosidase
VLVAAALLSGGCASSGPSESSSGTRSSTTTLDTTSTPTSENVRRIPATSVPTTNDREEPLVASTPVYAFDFPDPFVFRTAAGYEALSTASGLRKLPHLDSPTLTDWHGPDDVLSDSPSWAVPLSTWAPAVMQAGGQFLAYYAAQVARTEMHCISVATASSASGPYRDTSSRPMVCPSDRGGAIDPSPFVDRDGSRWLLWKNDGVTLRRESAIWSQRLSDDGLALSGEPHMLVATDQPWEFPHVEAPSMARIADTYWLAYSGNWWNDRSYGIGLARCSSVTGPCTKPFDHAVLGTRPGAAGPGGAEFFVDPSGRLLLAYHAWLGTPGYPGHRALFIARVDTTRDPPTIVP